MHPCELDAHELSAAIHARELSCRELMQATLARIEALNPQANAIVNLAPADALLRQADAADARLARGASDGWLHGMPLAVKDTGQALGFPTSFGSPLLAREMPDCDSLYVQRMKAAGAIVIGKTNMPELGLGSHTFNPLFGATPNAWDPALSAGGSSGGAAVALALRMLALADGSDFMGSLRNPAGWNHVIGLRPSQGRVPGWPRPELFVGQLATDGPMGRRVRDVARLLSIQAGADPRAPLAIAEGPRSFVPPPDASLAGLRIGWLGDLDGHLAVEEGILACCTKALQTMEGGGARVLALAADALHPDLHALWQAWLRWRQALVAPQVAALLARPGVRREQVKPEALWELDQAAGLSAADFMHAAGVRSAYHARLLQVFERVDLLALPVAQCWPFPLGERWPHRIAGRTMQTYHQWMECTLYASFGGLPAISLPAGFHPNGRWPCGIQLIGRPQGDAALLLAAQGWENLAGPLFARRPAAPAGGLMGSPARP
jgi:amidase